MDDPPANQTPGENFNKIDLSALEAFQFGTQWDDSGDSKKSGERHGGEHDRSSSGEHAPARRDRRPPRRTQSYEGGGEQGGQPSADAPPGERPPRERFGPRPGGPGGGFDRRPRYDRGGGGGGPGGGQRFDRGGGERRFERGGDQRYDRGGPRRPAGPPRPYVSPVFEVTFYPDDVGFNALVKAMRASCRTYELFEIARLILGKPERCVVVFRRRSGAPMDPERGDAAAPPSPPAVGNAGATLAISVPSGVPFESEDEAINHTLEHHLDQFFTTETVEVEPPKGAFQFVNRCPITKELLGPPNYHRYAHLLQQHYTTRGIRMPFEKFKASIEVVRDPEVVNSWLESMKKATRYTFRGELPAGETAVFDNLEDARAFLLRTCRDRVVRTSDSARISAKVIEPLRQTEAFRAMHGALEMQQRFPLDSANALRGRLRRENFNIFKRGSKGITYVCSVRRKFRQVGQTFSDTINRVIDFLDQNPMISVAEVSAKFLGFSPPPPAPPPAAAPAPPPAAEQAPPDGEPSAPVAPPPAPAPEAPGLTAEQKAALNRLMLDLRWLVTEGYVAEFSDGKLFAHPVMTPQAAGEKAGESAHDESAPSASDTHDEPSAESAPVIEPAESSTPEAGEAEAASESSAAETPAVPDDAADPARPQS